jgi:hypothetical protein
MREIFGVRILFAEIHTSPGSGSLHDTNAINYTRSTNINFGVITDSGCIPECQFYGIDLIV